MKSPLLIALTFLMAMVLTILPLPPALVWFRPCWVLLLLLFWLMAVPDRVGIGISFLVGLFLDLLTGTLLGQHALVFTLIAYFIVRWHKPVRNLPVWQQMLLILGITGCYLAIQFWTLTLSGASLNAHKYWWPAVTTTLFWPWVRVLLQDYQSRYQLYY